MEHTMTICYCEDESAQAKAFAIKIDQWAKNKNTVVRTDLFECAEEYLFKAEQNAYDVIFLDISMRGQNGMELARQIREKEKDVILVFVTSDASYVFDGYEVGAYRYLMKPVDEEKLWEILDYARMQKEVEEENYILVKKDSQSVRVNLKDIIYIEAQKHYVNLCMENKESINIKTAFTELLQETQEKSDTILLTHRSYAVNIEKVVRIGRTECVLSDSSVIPVSRSFYKEVNEAFIKYHLGRE
jgi:DNA-binding LytR/AlgR family response regulator